MDALDCVKATSDPMNAAGATYYFHPDTVAKAKANGLDGFRMYMLGRGGAMGNCDAAQVVSAFGYWNPGLIEKMWASASETMAPRDAGLLYAECCADLGRAKLADVDGLDAYNEAAAAVIAAADPAGLALYAGYAALPVPDDAPARAAHFSAVLREYRGSVHLLALIASGVDPVVAHSVKRPDMVETFGWSEGRPAGDDHESKRAAAEALTDQLMVPAFSALTDEQRQALASGVEAIASAFSAD